MRGTPPMLLPLHFTPSSPVHPFPLPLTQRVVTDSFRTVLPKVPKSSMDAIAPAALALTVGLDAAASLGLVLMSYEGPFSQAMLPRTPDVRLNIAAGLGDLLLATLLRGCLVMLPMLGLAATLPWLAAATLVVAAMTALLTAKAVLLYQLAEGTKVFLVQDTGVTLHLPTVLAAEVLGIFMAWLLLVLVWVNRRVMMQPAAGDPIISLTRTAAAMQQQRMAVQQWISQQEPPGEGSLGPELTAPLLEGAAAAEAGQAGCGVGGDEDAASFRSAHSRQLSNASWATAESSPGTATLGSRAVSLQQPGGSS